MPKCYPTVVVAWPRRSRMKVTATETSSNCSCFLLRIQNPAPFKPLAQKAAVFGKVQGSEGNRCEAVTKTLQSRRSDPTMGRRRRSAMLIQSKTFYPLFLPLSVHTDIEAKPSAACSPKETFRSAPGTHLSTVSCSLPFFTAGSSAAIR